MTILIVDTTVTKIVAMIVAVITAGLVIAATGLIIEPAFAFCNSSGSCVEVTGPDGVVASNPGSIAGTELSSTLQPGVSSGGGIVAAGNVGCGGNPSVFTSHTGFLCPP